MCLKIGGFQVRETAMSNECLMLHKKWFGNLPFMGCGSVTKR